MTRALEFYRDVLGFTVAFTDGKPVSFAVLKQGDAELHLAVASANAGSLQAHLMVSNLDAVHERLKASMATIRHGPKVQPWGVREMVVADPDGNTFELAEHVQIAGT
jgi:catechol 2,3-dioxygenase-like lactoylglutathione lyase family enzyme